ncbi:FAD-dependent oxidoreductase [Lichenihabitans psoromatis]|uniref:FAD-dependent oxidoreductase n=1 Tax=Lichenihabitans psoromatis TaxID=2528642 RepID=UPI0013F17465|nr:FAD-dependent oxidoreductase [Lichenihabitans psoromatis]
MTKSARVVVVGGGAVGCSVLYHLARKGWSNVVLCERTELTAGSTWHSAGHVIEYTADPTVSRLNAYGAKLYAELERLTGQNPGYHRCGNLRLATQPDRMDEFRRYLGIADVTGVEAKLLAPGQIMEIWPMLNMQGVLGGLLNPNDGHIAPADLTQAFAVGARALGARVYRYTEVTGFTPRDGEWTVHTSTGDIACEHVVSCTGNHSMQTMRMLGLPAQAVSLKHEYIVTDPIPELVARRGKGLPELPVIRDPEEMWYMRQEGDGFLMGCYEGRGECVFTGGVPKGFGMELFADELDKLLPFLASAIGRVPLLETVGIRRIVNGPQPYTPDDLPITGPVFGLRNFWLAEGNPYGITLAGGIGWQLAEWIVEGAPSIDMSACDPQRFGDHATRNYAARKTEEAYERTYLVPKPGEELAACRPLKVTPLHDLLVARGAVLGEVYGWERANWYAPEGVEPIEAYSYRTPAYTRFVGEEFAAALSAVVAADLSQSAKFRLSGEGACSAARELFRLAAPAVGRRTRAFLVAGEGSLAGEFDLFREADGSFILSAEPEAERAGLNALQRRLARHPGVRLDNLTGREGCLLVSGPHIDEALARLSRLDVVDMAAEDMGDAGFPVGTGRTITVGYAPVRAIRTDAWGPKAFELHCPSEFLRHVFLQVEGACKGLRLIGARTLEALRMSQAVPAWGRELGPLVRWSDRGFVDEAGRMLAWLTVSGTPASVPLGSEPLRDTAGSLVGATTSGGLDHATGRPAAFAYVDAAASTPGTRLSIKLLDEAFDAVVEKIVRPASDPRRPRLETPLT